MLNDESVFPKPDEFNPERFMPTVMKKLSRRSEKNVEDEDVDDERTNSSSNDPNDPSDLIFGFGRR